MASNDTASVPTKDSAVGDSTSSGKKKLSELYPVNSVLKLTLSPTNEVVEGLVYTTDEISNMVVLKKSLNYTTLASEIRMVNAASVVKKEVVTLVAASSGASGEELSIPLTNISKKTIEEREKRARKLAEESIRQINQKVSLDEYHQSEGINFRLIPVGKIVNSNVLYIVIV